jgi:hypothetical protein
LIGFIVEPGLDLEVMLYMECLDLGVSFANHGYDEVKHDYLDEDHNHVPQGQNHHVLGDIRCLKGGQGVSVAEAKLEDVGERFERERS